MRCLLLMSALLGALFFSPVLEAKRQPRSLCDGDRPSKRCLGGHLFVPSRVFDTPFLVTTMGTRIEGRYGNTLDTRVKPAESHGLGAVGVAYDLQVGLLDWLAVFGGFSAAAVSGATGGDFINFGVSGVLDYQLGAKFKLWQSERFYLSGGARLVGSSANGFTPIGVVTQASVVVDDLNKCNGSVGTPQERADRNAACDRVAKAFLKYQNELGARLNMGLAFAVNQTYGIWLDLAYLHQFRDPVNPLNFRGTVQSSVSASLDLFPTTEVPIAFLLGAQFAYRFDYKTSFDDEIASMLFSVGVFYSGSPNFSAGLEFASDISPVFGGSDVTSGILYSGSVNVRYFWN